MSDLEDGERRAECGGARTLSVYRLLFGAKDSDLRKEGKVQNLVGFKYGVWQLHILLIDGIRGRRMDLTGGLTRQSAWPG